MPKTKMQRKIESTVVLTCINCGKEFRTLKPNAKYCSKECSKAFNQNRDLTFHKETIFRRDEYRCIYCGKSSIEDGIKLHLDHVYPVSHGGGADTYNLVTACARCNLEKSNKLLPEEIIMRIWKVAYDREKLIVNESYDEMKKVFKKDLKARQDKLA